MTPEDVRSLTCGSKFTIRDRIWRRGRVVAYVRKGDPMNDTLGVVMDENESASFKRSDFLRDEFVLEG